MGDRELSGAKKDTIVHSLGNKALEAAYDSSQLIASTPKKQLLFRGQGENAALIDSLHPADGALYGFAPKTRLLGPAAAVLRYNCFSRIVASLAGRICSFHGFVIAMTSALSLSLELFQKLRGRLSSPTGFPEIGFCILFRILYIQPEVQKVLRNYFGIISDSSLSAQNPEIEGWPRN